MSYKTCLIIAGEKSGEDHALTFLPDLMAKNPECAFYGVGGDKLQALGVETLYDLDDFSGIGISEVLSKIPFYYKAMSNICSEVKKRNTDCAILVDFQTFNLKLAKKLKKNNVKVLYYVAPQAWVWKEFRVKTIEKCVHTLFTILPFEKKWFMDRGVSKVKSVIHPLMIKYKNELSQYKSKASTPSKAKTKLLLLPGSRRVEVSSLLPIYKKSIDLLCEQGYHFEVGIVKVDHLDSSFYKSFDQFDFTWDSEQLVEAMDWADMAIASSGTVTLTTGLFSLPTVVTYKLSMLSEFIFSSLVNYTGFISLTNIIHDNEVFPEFIQYECDRYNISKSLKVWIDNPEKYQQTLKVLDKTQTLLSGDDFDVSEYISNVLKDTK